MHILITNDDGYRANGIHTLAKIMAKYGEISVIAPKKHESGTAMAVDLGLRQLAYKDLGIIAGGHWAYLDATPASCVKFGINNLDPAPDLVVSGINHGSNASTGACYSGTLGACQEATLNGIPAIGVSLDSFHVDADFSPVENYLPGIIDAILAHPASRYGIYYNINFPAITPEEIKGIRITRMGRGRWVKEFCDWNPDIYREKFGLTAENMGRDTDVRLEEGEKLYMMTGTYVDAPDNAPDADHHTLAAGYITITPHNIINNDTLEAGRLKENGFERDFR